MKTESEQENKAELEVGLAMREASKARSLCALAAHIIAREPHAIIAARNAGTHRIAMGVMTGDMPDPALLFEVMKEAARRAALSPKELAAERRAAAKSDSDFVRRLRSFAKTGKIRNASFAGHSRKAAAK